MVYEFPEVGTNIIISKAQRSFQAGKAQRNFRNKVFDSVEAERHFRTKLKGNLTSALEISQHNAKTAFFAILDQKRANNLLQKGRRLSI